MILTKLIWCPILQFLRLKLKLSFLNSTIPCSWASTNWFSGLVWLGYPDKNYLLLWKKAVLPCCQIATNAIGFGFLCTQSKYYLYESKPCVAVRGQQMNSLCGTASLPSGEAMASQRGWNIHFEAATPLLIIARPYWLPRTCRTGGACEGKTSIFIS